MILGAGFEVTSWGMDTVRRGGGLRRTVRCDLKWRWRPGDLRTPDLAGRIAQQPGVAALRWRT